MSHNVAIEFRIDRLTNEEFETDDITMIGDAPFIDDVFMFAEDFIPSFEVTPEFLEMKIGKSYWVFIYLTISSVYSEHGEYGVEFDGWEWDNYIMSHKLLGDAGE